MKQLKTKMKVLPIALSLVLASSFIGCETEKIETQELESSAQQFVTIEWQGRELNVTKVGDVYMQDDIIFYPEDVTVINGDSNALQSVGIKKSTARTNRLWPDNTVYYVVNSGLNNTSQSRISGAIEHWEENTNLRFIERTNENAYVEFVPGSGCSSGIGFRGSRQTINLTPNCSLGNVIHEIGHTVGLFHEQSRSDRDEYVTVNFNNISSGTENNFQKWTDRTSFGADLTPSLDFGSIMMYGSFFFSSNGEPTITRRDGSTYRIQRTALSEGDLAGINILYPPINEPEPVEPVEPVNPTESGDNVALGRPTFQSSTAFGGSSSRAVDGNTSGVYRNDSTTHTANSNQPWWRVDLDETTSLESIIIFNRTDNCCVDRLSNFTVEALSETGEVLGSLFISNSPSPSRSIRANGIRAKSIRIRLEGTNPLSLAEVQVIRR